MSDLLNKAKSAMSGSGTSNTTTDPNAGAGQKDYGDKGLDMLEKKTGHQQSAGVNEKVTDAGRGMYEKATGSKVNPKFSN